MNLIKANDGRCTAASIAMVLEIPVQQVLDDLFTNLSRPFPSPWQDCELTPALPSIMLYLWTKHKKTGVLFPRAPFTAPAMECPPVQVWAEDVWESCLTFGQGLIGGRTDKGTGHMIAWDGKTGYDPRGWVGDFRDFTPDYFWMVK